MRWDNVKDAFALKRPSIQHEVKEIDAEGYSIMLKASSPENPLTKSSSEIVGQLWIQAEDQSTINVQLFQFKGSLQEIYLLFVDRKGRNRAFPETWTEVSREAVNG
jgi:hypothetical protein